MIGRRIVLCSLGAALIFASGSFSASGAEDNAKDADSTPVYELRIYTTADGRPMSVTLRQGACSDGMSDLRYDYVAEVSLAGETLKGCAGKADAMPREGS